MHALYDTFDDIPLAPQFFTFSSFEIPPIRTFPYLAGTVQDPAFGLGGITLRHCFRTAARREQSLRGIVGPITEFAARERVSLLDESDIDALYNLDCSIVSRSLLFDIVDEVLIRQIHYHLFNSSHHSLEVDLLTGKTTA